MRVIVWLTGWNRDGFARERAALKVPTFRDRRCREPSARQVGKETLRERERPGQLPGRIVSFE